MTGRPDFRHDRAGTSASLWRRARRWPAVPDLTVGDLDGAPVRRVVVVAAHPDDETLGAGGLLASLAAGGHGEVPEISLVLLTAGEASHPRSLTTPASELAVTRRHEAARAAVSLGLTSPPLCWGVPDGAVAASADVCLRRLVSELGDGRRTLLIGPWRRDGHPDHEAAGRLCATAAARTGARYLAYPLWFWHWGDPTAAPWAWLRRLHLSPEAQEAKDRATACHHSQVTALSPHPGDEVLLGPALLAHFRTREELYIEEPMVDDALDRLHQDLVEPWAAPSSWFERRKRDLVLAMLPEPRPGRVLEVGASTGVLTTALARRSREVLAVDASPAAVAVARDRLSAVAHANAEVLRVPDQWPDGTFDLVVLSEVGYFLSPRDLDGVLDHTAACLAEDGVVLLCHWRHPIDGWSLDPAAVHAAAESVPRWRRLAEYRDDYVEALLLGPAGRLPGPR